MGLPSRPVGFTTSTTTSTANTIASAHRVEIYVLDSCSINPSRIPPSMAPGIEPMPPNTAAVNALMPGMAPVVGLIYT